MEIYEAEAEDLTHLGGPMGTEYTTGYYLGLFGSEALAKGAAQKHWTGNKQKGTLKWLKEGKSWRTEDLGWIMYHVKVRKINER